MTVHLHAIHVHTFYLKVPTTSLYSSLKGAGPSDEFRALDFKPITENFTETQKICGLLAENLRQLALIKAAFLCQDSPKEMRLYKNYPETYFPEAFICFRKSNCILEIYYALKKYSDTRFDEDIITINVMNGPSPAAYQMSMQKIFSNALDESISKGFCQTLEKIRSDVNICDPEIKECQHRILLVCEGILYRIRSIVNPS